MDLSKVKWIVIAAAVLAAFWLITTPGTAYMFNKLKAYTPGNNATDNELNETSLSKLGGYLFDTLRYGKAEEVLQFTVNRYPQGKHVYYNLYRLVRCHEKRQDYRGAVDLLKELIAVDAHQHDNDVPVTANLKLRANKLIELYGLGEEIP